MGDITENFSGEEFACKCGCGFDDIDERLVHRLQVVRDIIDRRITINSGCRCENHNREVGGKPHSKHLEGKAADWKVDDPKIAIILRKMLKNWSGGFHYYDDKKFFHTDIGSKNKRRW